MLLFLDFSGGEFLLIAIVFLMFFGSKSIPGIAKSLGKAMREFKDAANSVQRDIQESSGMNEIKEHLNMSPDNNPAQQQPTIKLPEVVPPRPEEPKKENDKQGELPL
jgi:sec-independent protein translocase protein TatA